jgi:insertion element IS1 protein InsB
MGDRGAQTGKRLWNKIKEIDTGLYCTDHWKAYESFIPSIKHLQGKAYTFNIENLNGRIRHYLARFHRKTKCWSKSIEMVNASLKLLFHKFNSNLSF